ncbi:hypothetical protein [Embleya sp. NBC_00896]|uniref:hypothetical protein n=1 Tax=Embleya sp. NBC_00896 TaxID=2975961 RepID=UPI002F909C79|nr:hypothetical protein OG928_44355 [Embleya sp. NBC_00896]
MAGAFSDLLPSGCQSYSVAAVYAEFAHRRGRLRPDRVLAADEYDVLRGMVRRWASRDRVWADVVAEFGVRPCCSAGGTVEFCNTGGRGPRSTGVPKPQPA